MFSKVSFPILVQEQFVLIFGTLKTVHSLPNGDLIYADINSKWIPWSYQSHELSSKIATASVTVNQLHW